MKILKYLVIGTLVLIAGLVGVGFFLPDTVHVERSTTVNARPSTAYAVLDGFKQFNKWSPWAGIDPNTKYESSGPIWGVGAKHAWSSEDANVGKGSQEIIASERDKSVTIKLIFEGFDSDNTATYTLTPEGEGTKVTWGYDSTFKGNLLGRYFGTMMDGMLGPDYEKGLAQLKTLIESLPKDDFTTVNLDMAETKALPILYFSDSAGPSDAAAKLTAAYAKVMEAMAAQGVKQVLPPLAITRKYDEATKAWDFDAAIIVDKDVTPPADSPVKAGKTYAGWTIRATHVGSYDSIEPTYQKLIAFKTVAGFEDNGNSWEHYITDPTTTTPDKVQTHVYWPVK